VDVVVFANHYTCRLLDQTECGAACIRIPPAAERGNEVVGLSPSMPIPDTARLTLDPVDDLLVKMFLDDDGLTGVVSDAPRQCFLLGTNRTTSPGRISSTGQPYRCTRPSAVTTSV
jgi:hypothetical protein